MRTIVNFGLNKDVISSTLYTVVRYGTFSLGGIGLVGLIVIQVSGRIAFLVGHLCKPTPSIPLLRDNISTLQIEAYIRKLLPQNSIMVTYRVLDTRGFEIHVC